MPSDEPNFGTECKVTCPHTQVEIIQLCNQTIKAGGFVNYPKMVPECPTTTTTTNKPISSTVAVDPTAKVYIQHAFDMQQDFPEGATGESLMKDTALTKSLITGLK